MSQRLTQTHTHKHTHTHTHTLFGEGQADGESSGRGVQGGRGSGNRSRRPMGSQSDGDTRIRPTAPGAPAMATTEVAGATAAPRVSQRAEGENRSDTDLLV